MTTIAIIDDDDDVRDAVCEVLFREGYRTIGFATAQAALEALRTSESRPSLILLDLMMPRMDGWEFLSLIDEDPELHSIPVALLSAHPSVRRALDASRTQEKESAARFLFPKPLNLLRLFSLVHRLCPLPAHPG